MDLSLDYRLMCLKAEELQRSWSPKVGDFMIAKASYCGEDSCSEDIPCSRCLESSNDYVISGKFDFHESIGGTHWYYGGHSCVRGYGNRMNSTSCYIMTKTGIPHSDKDTCYSAIHEKLWLPRQDQIQQMFNNDKTAYGKTIDFLNWVIEGDYDPFLDTYEMLWLSFYMRVKWNKKWDFNLKDWQDCEGFEGKKRNEVENKVAEMKRLLVEAAIDLAEWNNYEYNEKSTAVLKDIEDYLESNFEGGIEWLK